MIDQWLLIGMFPLIGLYIVFAVASFLFLSCSPMGSPTTHLPEKGTLILSILLLLWVLYRAIEGRTQAGF